MVLPLPDSFDEGVKIVETRVLSIGKSLDLPDEMPPLKEIQRLVTIFRELRQGKSTDNKTKMKSPSGTLSTAEAIQVINNWRASASHFGDGLVKASDIAAGLMGSVLKDPVQDKVVSTEYLETIVKERDGWKDLYRACKELVQQPEQLKLILEILAQNPDMDEKNNPPKRKNTSTFRSH